VVWAALLSFIALWTLVVLRHWPQRTRGVAEARARGEKGSLALSLRHDVSLYTRRGERLAALALVLLAAVSVATIQQGAKLDDALKGLPQRLGEGDLSQFDIPGEESVRWMKANALGVSYLAQLEPATLWEDLPDPRYGGRALSLVGLELLAVVLLLGLIPRPRGNEPDWRPTGGWLAVSALVPGSGQIMAGRPLLGSSLTCAAFWSVATMCVGGGGIAGPFGARLLSSEVLANVPLSLRPLAMKVAAADPLLSAVSWAAPALAIAAVSLSVGLAFMNSRDSRRKPPTPSPSP
jgi:hypothetical protein